MKQKDGKHKMCFTSLGLSDDLLKALERLTFTTPTPIQHKAIPIALEGKDVVGIAQTGTGKTFAFSLPMIQNIKSGKGTGLVIVPTRELAFQVREEINKIARGLGIKTALLIGGANIGPQIRDLKRNPHIVVATPGRLIDHIDRKTVRLDRVQMLVLDEADRMLDMGFTPQINQVLKAVPEDHQTMLFSATMPASVAKISEGYMTNPVRVEVAPAGTSAKNIDQGVFYVEGSKKFELLQEILKEYSGVPVLVFCRTKRGTRKMARTLNRGGHKTEELHSDRSLNQRRWALANFKSGKSKTMIATDVAARGIDVKEIALVVNYDIPEESENYVHRIGRTGRAGHRGCAVTFAEPAQYRDMKDIEKLMGMSIEVLEGPGTLSPDEVYHLGAQRKSRPSKRNRGGSRRQGARANSGSRNSSRSSGRKSNKNRQFKEESPERYDPRSEWRKNKSSKRKPARRSGGNATSRQNRSNAETPKRDPRQRLTSESGQKSNGQRPQRRRSTRRSR